MPTPVYEEILLARLLLPFFSSGIRCKHLIETFASTTFSCSRDRDDCCNGLLIGCPLATATMSHFQPSSDTNSLLYFALSADAVQT